MELKEITHLRHFFENIVNNFHNTVFYSLFRNTNSFPNLTRAPLGGGYFEPPSGFLAISSKPMQVSQPNLQYPLSQQFYTLCSNFNVQGIIVWPQMTSE